MRRHTQILISPHSEVAADELALLRDNTLRLMQHGWNVPVLSRHAAAGSIDGGPQFAPVRAVDRPAVEFPSDLSHGKAPRIIGRLVDLVQLPDGSLAQVIEVGDGHPVSLFTSPEIRPRWIDAGGQEHGPIIAHIALTDRPLSRGQTPLRTIANNEHPHLSLFEEGAETMSQTLERTLDAEVAEQPTHDDESPTESDVVETERPQRELPETDALPDEDTVLAEDESDDSEDERRLLASHIHHTRTELAQRIRTSRRLPKGFRERMADLVETRQFSDDEDGVPRVPVAEAVEMIEAAIPENLQLAEGPLETPAHPRGESFFTSGAARLSDADAQRIAAEQLAATGYGPAT